jgi:hypothetical protein
MKKQNIEISIDNDNKIIVYQHSGLLSLSEIGDAWKAIIEMAEFSKLGYNLLSDYSSADFDFSINQTDQVFDFLYSIKDILKGKKEAVITSNPLTTAISVFFENESYRNFQFEVKTFSTREVAVEWLLK